jgi:tRNA A22 N-methylase
MARKSAIQKIEAHEKLCRIMQKQTFDQIKEMRERIKRIEYMIVAGMGSIIAALLMNYMK